MDLSIGLGREGFKDRMGRGLRVALGWPARVVAARRVMRQLGEMSAHELKDIGLMPHDLQDATSLPLDADPTRMLAQRVRDRRRAR